MSYAELVAIILGISLILYVVLGGADFGAGIIEIIAGPKYRSTISKAMGPVWEANHIWLIIAVVILFNGFPKVYSTISTALHIPLLITLVGITFRGAAFTFRHYDAFKDGSQKTYSLVFQWSSILTVFFLGICLGAVMGGSIPAEISGSFFSYYMAPWLNVFTISVGLFTTVLSAYIAAIFLLGEVDSDEEYERLHDITIWLFAASVLAGGVLFLSAYLTQNAFPERFLNNPVSIASAATATALVPFIFRFINAKRIWPLRVLGGGQVLLIIAGWFVIQWPDFVIFSDSSTLNIANTQAPFVTMRILFWALFCGVLVIFPSLYYLFKIFKS
jgi:cytochrome d ubiquinol oxidase subunit II